MDETESLQSTTDKIIEESPIVEVAVSFLL